jgi:hypothetical protein
MTRRIAGIIHLSRFIAESTVVTNTIATHWTKFTTRKIRLTRFRGSLLSTL